MHIRIFASSDRDPLVALWNEVFDYYAPHQHPRASLDAKLAVDDRIVVAEHQGKIIGSIMVGYDGHRGWLYSVAVAPDQRRTGLGSKLVRHAIAELARIGCMKVNLQVQPQNSQVVAFYESLGFAVEPRISMGLSLAPNDEHLGPRLSQGCAAM